MPPHPQRSPSSTYIYMYLIGTNCVLQSHTKNVSLLSGVSYPERGYDLFLTAAVADGAKLWDLRQDRNLTKLSQLPVQLCICSVLVLDTVHLMD